MRTFAAILIGCFYVVWASAQAAFSDVSAQAGILGAGNFRGVAFADYNNDGWEDIYFARLNGPNQLYRNNGDGAFTDVAVAAGVNYPGASSAAAWGDLDNDGFIDLVVGNRAENSRVYRNNGDGTFSDMTFLSGVITGMIVHSLMLADVDNDGWLDIYFANVSAENALFQNIGSFQFVNVTQPFGVSDPRISMGAVFFDYDNDNDQDLYLTHDAEQPYILYRNNGDSTFTDVSVDVSVIANVNYPGQGMGVDVGDANNDGWMDIYITNLYENTLFLNDGDGTFTNISAAAGITDRGMGWGTVWMDCDNDGWQDIYVCNDSYFQVNGTVYDNVLYQNNGDLTFADISGGSPVSSPYSGYGAATADINRDGRLDLAVANSGNDGNQLFINETPLEDRHWISIRLEGVTVNRSAIGARAVAWSGGQSWTDQVIAGSSFCSQSSLQLHFAIGTATRLDSLIVYWPGGESETFTNLAADQIHHLLQFSSMTTASTVAEEPEVVLTLAPNPAATGLQLQFRLLQNTENLTFSIFDAAGRRVAQQEYGFYAAGAHQIFWDVSQLSSGIYWVECRTSGGRMLRKLIVY